MKRLKGLVRLAEEKGEKAHKEAIAMGLKYGGFGYWKDPQTGETKFKTVNDQLVPVEGEQEADLAGKGAEDEGGGMPGGPGLMAQDKRTAGPGATQQPRGPGAEPGRNIGTAKPGEEQAPRRMRWDPGPDGDHCVDSGQPPGDIPDDAFVKKTNYYQWTAGPDGTNFTNVSYDNIMKAAREQGDQTAQAPPGGVQEESEPAVELVEEPIKENAETNYKRDVAKLIARIKKAKENNKDKAGKLKKLIKPKIIDCDD